LRVVSEGDTNPKYTRPLGDVAIQEESARRGDRELDMASAVEFEIHHGKITEVTAYHADTYHFDEFWS
jgi:hypothetical protein